MKKGRRGHRLRTRGSAPHCCGIRIWRKVVRISRGMILVKGDREAGLKAGSPARLPAPHRHGRRGRRPRTRGSAPLGSAAPRRLPHIVKSICIHCRGFSGFPRFDAARAFGRTVQPPRRQPIPRRRDRTAHSSRYSLPCRRCRHPAQRSRPCARECSRSYIEPHN
jgi:hypothetical protein